MQYILDEKEFKKYHATMTRGRTIKDMELALAVARDFILGQAEYTCIHKREGLYVGYCDDCPCSPIEHKDNLTWQIICGQSTAYGK